MTTVSSRAKSPTRAEAIAKALRPVQVYGPGVLVGITLVPKNPLQGSHYANAVVYNNIQFAYKVFPPFGK